MKQVSRKRRRKMGRIWRKHQLGIVAIYRRKGRVQGELASLILR